MEKNKLRKISKKELLEIMLNQAKRIKELEQELNKTQAKLDSKKIIIEETGSLAEASLKLNNVFETAQLAIEQYKYNVEEQCKKITTETKKECKIEKEKIIKETLERCQRKETRLDEKLSKVDKKIIELKLKEKELQKKEKEISKIKSNEVKKKTTETKINKKNSETIKIKKVKTSIKDKDLKIKNLNVSDLKHTINQKEVKV